MSFINSLFKSNSNYSESIEVLNADEFKAAIETGKVQLVDVRTASEYRGGHIKNAENIDFFDRKNFESSFEKFDKKKPVYLYCRSGNRSQKAARMLADNGFEKLYDLRGGYSSWRD